MEKIWRSIEAWLEENAPRAFKDLNKPATAKGVAAAEKLMGVEFPEDVRASYLLHDGQVGAAPIMGEWQLLSLKVMKSRWKMLKESYDEGKFEESRVKPKGPVKAEWWNPKWVPVAYNGAGDLYCVDLDPAPKGKAGQLVSFWHVDDRREVVAKSFRAWLKEYADDLKAGRYGATTEGKVKRPKRKR
jgi:cell wall assembly regulator SMI1